MVPKVISQFKKKKAFHLIITEYFVLGTGNVTVNKILKTPFLKELRSEETRYKYILKIYGMANGSKSFGGKTAGKVLDVREESSIKTVREGHTKKTAFEEKPEGT